MYPRPSPLFSVVAIVALGGCGDWPLYANLPDDTLDAAPAGTDPSDAIPYTWSDAVQESEATNDTPFAPTDIDLEDGWLVYGNLSDIGWDPAVVTTHLATCGTDLPQTTEYPPLSQGDYTGDEDWLSLNPLLDGQLCVRVEMTLPTDQPDFAYDMLGYTLDDCDNPIALLKDDTGTGLGLAQYTAEADWSTDVSAGTPLSILLAGFVAAASSETEVPWRLGIALIPSPANGGSGICPSLPEAQ